MMTRSWIALHRDWYTQERASFARHHPAFRYSRRDLDAGQLSYKGEFVIDLGERKERFPFVLRYPAETPYRPPEVFPLKELPAGDNWTWLEEVVERRWYLPEAYRRHQMDTNQLCLAEADYHRHPEAVGGIAILRRAKRVFRAVARGEQFPFPDSAEAELEAHFTTCGDILLSEAFFDEGLSGGGQFYAIPAFEEMIARSSGAEGSGRICLIGASLETQRGNGLVTGWLNAGTTAMERAFPWLPGAAFRFEQMLANEFLADAASLGRWYDLDFEPGPFRKGAELQSIFERAGVEDAGAELAKVANTDFHKALVGLRFPARGEPGRKEWLIVVAPILVNDEAREHLEREPEAIRELARDADVVALRAHPIARQTLELRNPADQRKAIASQRVLAIGCGALGGDIAMMLAKAGVGALHLVDPQHLMSGNIIRHECPLSMAGFKKVEALKRRIHGHNPFVEIETLGASATCDLQRLEKMLAEADLTICTTADEGLEMVVNEAAVRAGATVIYGRALRRGEAGRVFRVRPGVDACKSCLSLYALDAGLDWITIPEAEGEIVGRECGNPILAGSGVDLRMIASLAARAVVDEFESPRPWNTLIWSRESIAGCTELSEPYLLVKRSYLPHSACRVCRTPNATGIMLSKTADDRIKALAEQRSDRETGGVLVGYVDESGVVHVEEASDAGPNAIERPDWFERDRAHCQAFLDEAVDRLGSKGQYVGEWHTHLVVEPDPSERDIESLTGIAEAPGYLNPEPIMLIGRVDPTARKLGEIRGTIFPIGRGPVALDVQRPGDDS